MRTRHAVMLALSVLSIPAVSMPLQKARALEPERYTVYCADDRIEVSFLGPRTDEGAPRLQCLPVPELYELLKRVEFCAEEFCRRGGEL